jgi:hypothetical protein
MAKRNVGLDDSMANPALHRSSGARPGGARRDRTDDLVLAKHALSQLSYGPQPAETQSLGSAATNLASGDPRAQPLRRLNSGLVGLGRLELPTSRLSSARSNQLSYKPKLKHSYGWS